MVPNECHKIGARSPNDSRRLLSSSSAPSRVSGLVSCSTSWYFSCSGASPAGVRQERARGGPRGWPPGAAAAGSLAAPREGGGVRKRVFCTHRVALDHGSGCVTCVTRAVALVHAIV